jgi:hypothetical protein
MCIDFSKYVFITHAWQELQVFVQKLGEQTTKKGKVEVGG